jgi:hypothetical protein
MNDDELEFEKGDYVLVKETGEMGRIAGPGSEPGFWRVRLTEGGEKEVPGHSLEPVY